MGEEAGNEAPGGQGMEGGRELGAKLAAGEEGGTELGEKLPVGMDGGRELGMDETSMFTSRTRPCRRLWWLPTATANRSVN